MRIASLTPTVVRAIPDKLEDGVLYISMQYGTVVHRCCCGCGREVVTPLGPTEWKLTYDGKKASLYPSIGNWSFPCRSHYWIRGNAVIWAEQWSDAKIAAARARERCATVNYYNPPDSIAGVVATGHRPTPPSSGFWSELWAWLFGSKS